MIIVCQKCSSRLQVDDTKVPTKPFSIKCPKCNSNVEAGTANPAIDQGAISIGGSPSTEDPRFEHPNPAPLFELADGGGSAGPSGSAEKLVELLSGLMNQTPTARVSSSNVRPSWDPRKTLVCVPEETRELVARNLAEAGYQVFVANDTTQAVERMRGDQLDVVVLDPRFDPVEQGQVFVSREVNILRPAQRRRVFFVLLSPSLRTMDAHAAFLNNVNAIVNLNDLEDLPALIDHRVREFNELYKDFNHVSNVPAL